MPSSSSAELNVGGVKRLTPPTLSSAPICGLQSGATQVRPKVRTSKAITNQSAHGLVLPRANHVASWCLTFDQSRCTSRFPHKVPEESAEISVIDICMDFFSER
uniref:Uncharacterized protein n=1 Tax=Knipowitschia caucasica TaxID=637954 RepID=A0AAV2MQG9_KNICA